MADKVEIGTGFSRRTSTFSHSVPLHKQPTFIHSWHCNTKHLTLTQTCNPKTCMAQPLHDCSTAWQVPKLQMQGTIGTPENFPFRFKPLNSRSVQEIYSASAAPFLTIQQPTTPPHQRHSTGTEGVLPSSPCHSCVTTFNPPPTAQCSQSFSTVIH
jgi:hypothetical protein